MHAIRLSLNPTSGSVWIAHETQKDVHGQVSRYVSLVLTGRSKEGCKGQGACQGGGNCSGARGRSRCCQEDKVSMRGWRLGGGATMDFLE